MSRSKGPWEPQIPCCSLPAPPARSSIAEQRQRSSSAQHIFLADLWTVFLNQCHLLIRALLIILSPWGLAHDRAQISAADAQLHTCGRDSLQTLGLEVLVLSPVWLTPRTSQRHSRRCWWNYTYTNTNKQLLENTSFLKKSLSWDCLCIQWIVRMNTTSSADLKWFRIFALFNPCTQCNTFISCIYCSSSTSSFESPLGYKAS